MSPARPKKQRRAGEPGEEGRALSSAVEEYLRTTGLGGLMRYKTILDVWDETVGPEVARHCRPVRFDGATLFVDVDHQGWLTELTFRSADILRRLEVQLRAPIVKELKAHLARGLGVE